MKLRSGKLCTMQYIESVTADLELPECLLSHRVSVEIRYVVRMKVLRSADAAAHARL